MRPLTLEYTGLKSVDRKIELGRHNLFLGPVGAGKTSALDALRFLAAGYVPHNGKSEAATARLMRGNDLSVKLTFENRVVERSLSREKDRLRGGAVDSTMPLRSKVTDHAASIRALFGSGLEVDENLDLRELLAASGDKRAAKIQQLLDASGLSVDEITAICAPLAVARLAKFQEDRLPADLTRLNAVAAGLRETLEPAQIQALDAALREIREVIERTGLVGAIDRVNFDKAEAARNEKESRAARAKIEDRSVEIAKPAEAAQKARARRDAVLADVATKQAEIDRAIENRRVREAAEAPLPALRAAASEAQAAIDAAFAELPTADLRRAEADAIVDPGTTPVPLPVEPEPTPTADLLEAEAAAIIDPDAPAAPVLVTVPESLGADLVEEAKALSARADAIVLPELVSTAREESNLATAKAALGLAERNPWREVEAHANDIDEKVSTLGPIAVTVKVETGCLRELARVNGGDIEGIRASVTKAEAALALAKLKSEESLKAIADARAERAELRSLAEAKRDQAADARAAAVAQAKAANEAATNAYQATRAEWQKVVNDNEAARRGKRAAAAEMRTAALRRAKSLNDAARLTYDRANAVRNAAVTANERERARLRADADRIVRAARTAQEAKDKAFAALAAAEARLAGIESVTVDLTTTQAEVEKLRAELAELDKTLKDCEDAEARRREMAVLLADIERVTAKKDALAAIEWALQRARNEDLQRRSGGLVEQMTKFLRAAGRTETPYIRTEKSTCEFGWRRGTDEIAVEAMSGGESVLFSAALASAIIILRGPGVKALLIEGAELGSGEPAYALMRGAAAMDLDLVMVATNAAIEAPEGWNVVTCAAPAEVAAS